MRDGVGLANIGEELVAKALALGSAGHQSGDVDEFDRRRNHFLGLRDRGKPRQARIGYFDNADVGFDGAERIILCGDAGFGERVEQGGFADVGQADDAAFETHGLSNALGFVCSLCIAASILPSRMESKTARLRSIASSIKSRSSLRGGCRTKSTTSCSLAARSRGWPMPMRKRQKSGAPKLAAMSLRPLWPA